MLLSVFQWLLDSGASSWAGDGGNETQRSALVCTLTMSMCSCSPIRFLGGQLQPAMSTSRQEGPFRHGKSTIASGWERSSARITQKVVADPKRSSRKLDSWPASGHSAQAHHASMTDDMPRLPPLLLVEVLPPHRVKQSYRTRLLLGLDVCASAFTAGSGCGLQSFDLI